MTYLDKKRKALEIVENYYGMIFGVSKDLSDSLPSHDREDMYQFLRENKQDVPLIHDLFITISRIDELRIERSIINGDLDMARDTFLKILSEHKIRIK